jgi:hypothetical protein
MPAVKLPSQEWLGGGGGETAREEVFAERGNLSMSSII